MKMEHVALNVSDPMAMAVIWYRDHLGFENCKGNDHTSLYHLSGKARFTASSASLPRRGSRS